jgi:hypothetical protein
VKVPDTNENKCPQKTRATEELGRLLLSHQEVDLLMKIYQRSASSGRRAGEIFRYLIFCGYDATAFPRIPHHTLTLAGVTPELHAIVLEARAHLGDGQRYSNQN